MLDDALRQMNNLRKAQIERNKENWKIKSKQRLEKILKTKMTTLMIGSLDAIEKTFGYLWGNGNPEDNIQEQFFKEWLLLRQIILDLGNKQIRAMQKELQQYDTDWSKYQGVGQLVGGNDG